MHGFHHFENFRQIKMGRNRTEIVNQLGGIVVVGPTVCQRVRTSLHIVGVAEVQHKCKKTMPITKTKNSVTLTSADNVTA